MTNLDRTALRSYFRSIRSFLTCPRKQKKQILRELKTNIAAFLEENPQANFEAIASHFGSPQQIASTYLGDLTDAELLHKLQIRKKLVAIIAGVMAAILVIWLAVVGWAIINERKIANGGAEIGPAVEATQ